MITTIDYDTFFQEYEPVFNNEFEAYDGFLFDPTDVDFRTALKTNIKKIWTLIDGEDETQWIIPGYHVVNRVGYFITENAWENEDVEVDLNDYISQDECIKHVETIFKELGYDMNLSTVSSYYPDEKYSTGAAKYICIEIYENHITEPIPESHEDEIHNYYSQI